MSIALKTELDFIQYFDSIKDELKICVKDVKVEDLRDSLGIFQISSDIEVIKDISEEDIRNAASFLLLNQLLFFRIIGKKIGLQIHEQGYTKLQELAGTFDFIRRTGYNAVYGVDILKFMKADSISIINSIIQNLSGINFQELRKDLLGKIFHSLIPLNLRKRIAAFYTSNNAGEFLARLCVFNENDKILDPACGSGTLLVSALNQKIEASSKHSRQGQKELLSDIFGFDISFFAAHLAVINLTIQNLNAETGNVFVFIDNFMKIFPSESKKVLFQSTPKTQVSEDGNNPAEIIVIPRFNVILSNPPFTRVERLTKTEFALLNKLPNIQGYMFGQAGLHIAFIIHCTNFLTPNGYFGLILPAATFSSNYSKKIEEFILNHYIVKYFIVNNKDITFSEGCDFKEVVCVLQKLNPENESFDWKAKFVTIKIEMKESLLKMWSEAIINCNEDSETENLKIRFVSQSQLSSTKNWFAFMRENLEIIIQKISKSPKLVSQNAIIRFHEGYHLDAPYVFRIPNETWKIVEESDSAVVIENTTEHKLTIPKQFLTKSMDVPEFELDITPQMKSYILTIENTRENRKLPDSDLKKYIEWGQGYKKNYMSPKKKEEKSVLDLYKIRKYINDARPWYTYGHYTLQHKALDGIKTLIGGNISIIWKFRTKTRPNIAYYSQHKLTGQNALFFGEVIQTYKPDIELIAAWFCSSFYLLQYLYSRREISGDYGHIKKDDFAVFRCFDPSKLDKSQKNEILIAFRDYRTNFPKSMPLYEQILNRNESLNKLDNAILSSLELNIEQQELDSLLEELYNNIILELDAGESNN